VPLIFKPQFFLVITVSYPPDTMGKTPPPPNGNKGCVTLCGLANYLKAKSELWKFKIFHYAKIYNLGKKIL
jgi:hypothetical protein